MHRLKYPYKYKCLYLFILRSVYCISCCSHGDQILRSSPHQLHKDRQAWTMEMPPWKLQQLEEQQQSQRVTLQPTCSQSALVSSPSWGSWKDLITQPSCHSSGALSDENARLSVVWSALADPLCLEYDLSLSLCSVAYMLASQYVGVVFISHILSNPCWLVPSVNTPQNGSWNSTTKFGIISSYSPQREPTKSFHRIQINNLYEVYEMTSFISQTLPDIWRIVCSKLPSEGRLRHHTVVNVTRVGIRKEEGKLKKKKTGRNYKMSERSGIKIRKNTFPFAFKRTFFH